jgi:hypothetical protein
MAGETGAQWPSGQADRIAHFQAQIRIRHPQVVALARASPPPDAVLGRVEGLKGFHDAAGHEGSRTTAGIVLYRFAGGLIFFHAPYFKKRVLEVLSAHPDARWFVVDGAPMNGSSDSPGLAPRCAGASSARR